MSEVFPRPDHWPLWADAADGKPVDWDKIFDGFGAMTDAPACLFYKQIADHYPDAKVVLSMRDADRWFELDTIDHPLARRSWRSSGTCRRSSWT